MLALPRLPLLSALFVALLWAVPSAARADDAPNDDSAASKTYRDAWWAETGGGNLTQALELYAKAVDAQGPAPVRARALYRRAVVLQRIGKTEEAIRALERLAKDFPGETQANADARARLTEWTAVDLRSSFGEWFKRYQYSPEFQAKIVELVLKLGSEDAVVRSKTSQELLTIGTPAIPALREHVRSKNRGVASRAMQVLLTLGEVPDEIVQDDLIGEWRGDYEAWKTIVTVGKERGALLAERVAPSHPWGGALRAALRGPEAILEWLPEPVEDPREDQVKAAVAWSLVSTLPKDAGNAARIAALIQSPGMTESVRSTLAWWLEQSGLLTGDHIRAWAADESRFMRAVAWNSIGKGSPLTPPDAWPIVLKALTASPGQGQRLRNETGLERAFLATLPAAPWPADLDRAGDAVENAGFGLSVDPTSIQGETRARLVQIFERLLARTLSDDVHRTTLDAWLKLVPVAPHAVERLARLAISSPTPQARNRALQYLGVYLPPDRLGLLVDVLADPALTGSDLDSAWSHALGQTRWANGLLGNAAHLRRLVDRLATMPDTARDARTVLINHLLRPVRDGASPLGPLLEVWLAAPEKFAFEFWRGGNQSQLRQSVIRAGALGTWQEAWRRAWAAWTPAQRARGLWGLDALLEREADGATRAFLRERLRAQPGEVPAETRAVALRIIGELTLDDLRAAFDLSKPEDVDMAAGLLGNVTIEVTRELLDALVLALRPDGNAHLAKRMGDTFGALPELQRTLIGAFLSHKDGALHDLAVGLLGMRSAPEDEDFWLRALSDERSSTRQTAAESVERVPTEGVKRALVKALDDLHPDVRAAALASLEAIQKLEDQKARWRERIK